MPRSDETAQQAHQPMSKNTAALPNNTCLYKWFGNTPQSFADLKGRGLQGTEIVKRARVAVAGGRYKGKGDTELCWWRSERSGETRAL